MIKLSEKLWISNSAVNWRDMQSCRIQALFNVAQDLRGERGWPDVEYMQVGLIDGPGNVLSTYYAAILALATLVRKHRTLVFCHTGSRSTAIAVMYMNITAGYSWDGIISLLTERVNDEIPIPHEAHKAAFDKIDWHILRKLCQ